MALVAVVAMLAVAAIGLLQRQLVLVMAIACLGVAIAAAFYALTRTGVRRLIAVVVAILALGAPLALVVADGRLLQLLLLIALVPVSAVATRHGLGRGVASLKTRPTPGTIVGPAIRPVLLMNPRSGGGTVERFHLVKEARRRGIESVVLGSGADQHALAEQVVAWGADGSVWPAGTARRHWWPASPPPTASGSSASRPAQLKAFGGTRRAAGWTEWTDTSFEVRAAGPVEVGVDGERCWWTHRSGSGCSLGPLRVRIPAQAPGYSPAAAVPTPGWATLTALWQTAAGRPVTIEP